MNDPTATIADNNVNPNSNLESESNDEMNMAVLSTTSTSTSTTTKSTTSTPTKNQKEDNSTKNSSSNKNNRIKKNQTSFTADSPYFTAYVDKEMKNLNVLTTTLRDISNKAKTFGKCGVLMSEATRRLSSACKLQPNSHKDNGNGEDGNSGSNSSSGNQMLDESQMDAKTRNMFEAKKKSVGSDMVGVLQVLGRVS